MVRVRPLGQSTYDAHDRLSRAWALVALVGWQLGCSGGTPSDVGCVKDVDCKGARVCVAGMCVDQAGGDAGPANGMIGADAAIAPDGGTGLGGRDAATFDAAVGIPPVGGDAGVMTSGGGVVKFCNPLRRNGQSFDLSLEVGSPPTVRLIASSGRCSPPLGQACSTIPAGKLPLNLLDGTRSLAMGSIDVRSGDEWLITAELDMATSAPTIEGGVFKPEFKCMDTDPLADSAPPADAGPGSPDTASPPDAGSPSPDAASSPSGTQVSGTITGATWSAAGSPYVLTGDLSVVSLQIQPGVTVTAAGDYQVEIAGQLQAVGTKTMPITFTTAPGTAGWKGLFFNASQASELAHVVVENSQNGGIRIADSSPTLRNCVVRKNTAGQGGGIKITGSNSAPVIKNCILEGNTATDFFEAGGGLFVKGGSPKVLNSVIASNKTIYANARGGGIFVCGGTLTLTNVAVVKNGDAGFGNGSGGIAVNTGGLSGCGSPMLIVKNSIVFNNNSFQIQGTPADVAYSDVQGGFEGMGNIGVNPLFADDAYHLTSGSPCADTGNPEQASNDACLPPAVGAPRNDMGAYGGPEGCGW